MSRSGIVNVRMVITEEKILSNIAKVQRLIDPNSKKQIVQLEDDAFFKDLVESIKTYLIEYPKKKNFPKSVYKAAYGLVEFATNEFEENTKQIEELIRQREKNIALSGELKDVLNMVVNKEDGWKESIKEMSDDFTEDILDTLGVIGRSKSDKSQNYQDALKLINARIANLESNLHIEIDMERIEDKSKALSYIGIEVADALKLIPAPQEDVEEVVEEKIIRRTIIRTDSLMNRSYEINSKEDIDKYVEELKEKLAESLELLTEKERRVIELYYYEDMTLKEISKILEVSESRISQLHTKALNKMRKKMGVYMNILTE